MRGELHDAQECQAMTFMDLQGKMTKVNDCQEVVDLKCRAQKDSCAKFNEAKQKAEDAGGHPG